MREFNTFGPAYPDRHYHVSRVAVKAELRTRIDKGRYLLLNDAGQSDKTTLFQEIITEVEATGEYFGILLDFARLGDFDKEAFYKELSYMLTQWWEHSQPAAPMPVLMRHHGDFVRWLQACVHTLQKQGLLIIDNFGAIDLELAKALLSLFRGMFHTKYHSTDCIHSMILVGVSGEALMLDGRQSPFNIAEFFYLPDLQQEENLDKKQSL